MSAYEVIVGNIGTVYDGTKKDQAWSTYKDYAKQSMDGYGKVAGESVSLLCDGEPIKEHTPALRILSIEAWREPGGGWTWNQWFNAGSIEKTDFEKLTTNRKILKYFRDNGYTSEFSVGRASVEDDGHNIVICERSNGMPLFAIEYGSAY